jgi:3-carboxy-cis,cis-muconate cycloisomerase
VPQHGPATQVGSGVDAPRLLDPLFVAEPMRQVFSDRARLQAMLDVEAALARAEATVGVIPADAAPSIIAKCRAELFDARALAETSVLAGNPAIPMVQALTTLVGADDPAAMRYVHWGATSQDIMDSGLVLQLRAAVDLFDKDLSRLSAVLADLAERHKTTLLAGRTWMQHALPTTFGIKAAGWLSAAERHRHRLAEIRPRLLTLQFGGAVGTLAPLDADGLSVAATLADYLMLALPDIPWHSHRDRVAELATTLGLLVGTLGKIARDISLLMQSEVGEAFEPTAKGRGGSSAMPHKRNPVRSAIILSAALRVPALVSIMLGAMVEENERGLGSWHAEWETLPDICRLAAGALQQTVDMLAGLDVDTARMRRNLEVTNGMVFSAVVAMAMAPHLGARAAHELVEQAVRRAICEHRHLAAVLADEPAVQAHLSQSDLADLFDPARAIGQAAALVDRVLAVRLAT